MSNSLAHNIALLASPGLGHLIPIIELAKRLIAQHRLIVTIFAITTGTQQAEDELLQSATSSWPGLINVVVVPIQKEKIPSNIAIFARLLAMTTAALPAIRSSISNMENKPIALIVDLFCTEAIEKIAKEFNMLKYVFITTNARWLSLALYLPYGNKEVNLDEPIHIPGCEPMLGDDLPELIYSLKERSFDQHFVRLGLDIAAGDGILVNTWEDLESKTLLALRDEQFMKQIAKVPVYPIGPVIRTDTPSGLYTTLIKWLDRQPTESVVYVSFGSGGTLSSQQTIELAWGLELSKQRFIWVVRPPIGYDTSVSLSDKSMHGEDELIKYLPEGFLDRTHEVGFIVPMWAPQEKILSHGSIGGFISHCGWNSSLESIVNGVPIICWPLYAEQKMNATMLANNLGIAVRPQVQPSREIVGRYEVAKLVRMLMVDKEGIDIRRRVKELKSSADKALREGGSSYGALFALVKDIVAWKNLVTQMV